MRQEMSYLKYLLSIHEYFDNMVHCATVVPHAQQNSRDMFNNIIMKSEVVLCLHFKNQGVQLHWLLYNDSQNYSG